MPRNKKAVQNTDITNTTSEGDSNMNETVDTPQELDEVETVEVSEEEVVEATDKTEEKDKKEPARPPVPEGFVTPIGFAKALSEKLGKEVRPQVIYSYIRNASKEAPLPTYEEGGRQNLLKLDEALAWWDAKDERVAARKANAAEKLAKKEAKAKEAPAEAEASEDTSSVEVVEAE